MDATQSNSSAPEVQQQTNKEYVYNKNGKEIKVTRKYNVKNSNTMKSKTNKERVIKYFEDNKDKYINLDSRKQISTLIKDIKTDLNIEASYNGILNLLKKQNVRSTPTIKTKQEIPESSEQTTEDTNKDAVE